MWLAPDVVISGTASSMLEMIRAMWSATHWIDITVDPYLDEADQLRLLTEALSANVDTVFPDHSPLIHTAFTFKVL